MSESTRAVFRGTQPAGTSLQERWEQLLDYARECVAAESSTALVPLAEGRGRPCWHIVPGAERLVTGQVDSVPAPPDLSALLDSAESRDAPARSVAVGWPTVVVRDGRESGRPESVAPLFTLQASPERKRNGRWTLGAATEPEFNLAIAAAGFHDSSVADEIEALGVGTLFGNPPAITNAALRACTLLGIPVSADLDPAAVESPFAGVPPGAPAVHNLAVSVAAEFSGYRLSLHRELQVLQRRTDWSGTAAALLVKGAERSSGQTGNETRAGPLAAPLPVNRSQEETLERIRHGPLTVVTGPPGTGKTQLVVNAVANAWLDGDTVLVTSTNNAPVDVATERAIRDVAAGLLLRTGNLREREALPDRANAAREQAEGVVTAGEPEHEARGRLTAAAGARTALLRRMARLAELDRDLLIASRSLAEARIVLARAAGVLWPGDATPVGVDPTRAHARASRLENAWLFGNWRRGRFRNGTGCSTNAAMKEVVRWADAALDEARMAAGFAQRRTERVKLADEMGAESDAEAAASGDWADASLASVRTHVAGRILAAPSPALGAALGRRETFPRAVANSFKAFRGWACTTLTANPNFPLQPGLFDLAIVDEASQYDLAAVLPIAYRAKRLAVVGDPEQLRPIANVSTRLLDEVAVRKGLDPTELRRNGRHHGEGSAYRAFEFASGRPASLLDEHYRCHPYIARWFNQAFYGERLTVLTDVSGFASGRVIAWRDVPGAARRPTSGSGWEHPAQAEAVVEEVGKLLGRGLSVGVVTPYAAQARLIDRLVRREYGGEALGEAGFICGTAHRLQGDERDAVILVSVLSPGMPWRSAAWVEKERNLLNVAVSRARQTLIAIGHPDAGTAGSPTLASLRDYLRRHGNNGAAGMRAAPDLLASDAELRALEAMRKAGLDPLSKVSEGGYELDFALLSPGGAKLDIEIDGDQHHDARGEQRRIDHARDRLLQKLGWRVLRIPAWRCHEDPDGVGEEILRAVSDHGPRVGARGGR